MLKGPIMSFVHDRFLTGVLAAITFAGVSFDAAAQQNYPAKPVRIIVPSSSGGGTDILARQMAPKLTERWGQQVIVDNRPGAGMMIGIELAARAAPDGYTLLMPASPLALNSVLYKKVPYDPINDFAPIAQVAAAPNILITHPSLPVRNVKDLIALAKARPGQLVYGSAGIGTSPHMAMELFLSMTGTRMGHVPYKGTGPSLIDTLAGQVQVLMSTLLPPLPHLKTGRLRALGITGLKRVASLPDVPTVAETGVPGYEVIQWYGLLAPANTPRDIIAKVHTEVANVMGAREIREKLSAEGAEPLATTPDQFAAFIKAELDKWTKVAKVAKIQQE
jgi:tripartite-type tricarboxylate transporter receptor subunit TctC